MNELKLLEQHIADINNKLTNLTDNWRLVISEAESSIGLVMIDLVRENGKPIHHNVIYGNCTECIALASIWLLKLEVRELKRQVENLTNLLLTPAKVQHNG